MKQGIRTILALTIVVCATQGWAAMQTPNPCTTGVKILSYVNRPTVGDSACVVPMRNALLENGYNYFFLPAGTHGQIYPQSNLRLGMPDSTEFGILFPNHLIESFRPSSGESPAAINLKHGFASGERYYFSMETILILPMGGGGLGAADYGGIINADLLYSLTNTVSVGMQFGVMSQTFPASTGGARYQSLNPEIVLSWQPVPTLDWYLECYGQSRIGPGLGYGFNADGGVLYSVTPAIEVDAEVGQRLVNRLGGFNQYIGVGLSVLI